jgi:hypothetical protein
MDPDQTAQMRRLVCIRSGRKRFTLVLSWRGSFFLFYVSDTPACLSLDLLGPSKIRHEKCNEPSMILTSLSTLNLFHDFEETFSIQARQHQSIDIIFIHFYVHCYSEPVNGKSVIEFTLFFQFMKLTLKSLTFFQ